MEPTPWTLDELSRRVQAVLTHGAGEGERALGQHIGQHIGQANGQVSEVPNARTIRYYTTIGLLDRPRVSGRTAHYGRRHLEQLIAIKRLQSTGKALAQVQQELMGLDDASLARLAALPADLDVLADTPHGPLEKRESRRERAFWGAEPAELEAAAPPVSAATSALPITGIQLNDGVTLAFVAARAVDDDDLEALRAALRPVVEIMRARGLLAAALEGEDR